MTIHSTDNFRVNLSDCGCKSADKKQIYMFNKAEFGLEYDVQTLNGEQYIVVPVVMVVEGVMNNALYSEKELSKNVSMWNTKPLPVPTHPKDQSGQPIPANTPEMVALHSVGQIMGAKLVKNDGITKLVAEAWINIRLAAEKEPELLERLASNQKVEVSTGLFTDATLNPGEFKGNSYQWIVSNFRADHLAILMNETGACSLKDGCGLNANNITAAGILIHKALNKVKNFGNGGNESFGELKNSAENAIINYLNPQPNTYVDVVHVDINSFIYEVFDGNNHNKELFKNGYTLNDDEELILNGEPESVKLEKNFVSVETESDDISDNDIDKQKTPNKGELNMEPLVNELINNSASPFQESDREYLMTQSEDRLKEMIPEEVPDTNADDDCDCPDVDAPKSVSANKETNSDSDKAPAINANDLAEVLKAVTAIQTSLPEMIANAVDAKSDSDHKTPLVNKLVELGCKTSKDTLMKFNMDDLKELYKAYNVNANGAYFGSPISGMNANGGNEEADAPPAMPVLFANGKAEEN